MSDNHGFWSAEPVASLIAAERAWLESRRVQWPQATEVWVHPARVAQQSGCLSLGLSDDGRLAGPLVARADLLPFADDSVQRIVLQHALDMRPAPQALLRESVRVLAPGGILVLFGFDALSPTIWRCRIARGTVRRAVGVQLPGRLAMLGTQLGLSDIQRFGFSADAAAGTSAVREGGWPRPAFALQARKNSRNVIALRRTSQAPAHAVGGLMPSASRRAEACR
jgi:SAM-dependent methyltransferase